MKNLRTLILLMPLLVSIWGCNEETFIEPVQYGSISGHVLSKKDGTPVSKAAVRLNPSGRTIQTDTAGRFRFDTLVVGKYTLQASKEALRDEIATVDVGGGHSSAMVLYMVQENALPTEPLLVAPTASSSAVATNTVLKWKATDSNKDPLTYEVVILREGSSVPLQTISGHTADSLVLHNLSYGTTYYWQVTVSDGVSTVTGKMWRFQTTQFPDVAYVFARRVGGRYQIFASKDGSTSLQLTHSASNWRPIVSPNRKQIAFISNAETDLHLFVMNHDGTNLRQVSLVPVGGLMPADLAFCWSPDGTQLLYPSNNKLYVVQADGSGKGSRSILQAPTGRTFAGCDWTPQGDRIIARTTGATVYDNRFVVMSSQGKDTATILAKSYGRIGNPVFSITGDKVFFAHDLIAYQNEQGRQLNAVIGYVTIPPAGSKLLVQPQLLMNTGSDTRLTKPLGTNDLEPRLSPDGSKLIFTNSSNTGTGESTVTTVELDGDKAQNRTILIKGAEMPYWR